MNDFWETIHRKWNLVTSPGRPHDLDVARIEREIGLTGKHVLLLGVTPEFARLGKTMVAVDAQPDMIGALWVGDDATRRAVVGNWLDLPLENNSVDAVVSDGCLTNMPTCVERHRLLKEISRVLKPEGRVAIRLFTGSDEPESLVEIQAAAVAGEIKNFTTLGMRILISLADASGDSAATMREYIAQFYRLFPDRAALVAKTGWNPEALVMIDDYRNSDAVLSFPTEKTSVEEARPYFGEVRIVESSGYELAERCPLMILATPTV